MCRFPVTFGGGIIIVNGFLFLSISGVKYPPFIQKSYSLSSNDFGSYVLSKLFINPPRNLFFDIDIKNTAFFIIRTKDAVPP